MKSFLEICTYIISCILLCPGHNIHAYSYNYHATTECLREPKAAFYGGGIIEERLSKEGNRLIVAQNGTHPLGSFHQKVQVEQGKIYSFSAWVQVSEGSEIVAVVFKQAKGDLTHGGSVIAKSGCWTLLKGGMVANFSSPVEIFFESKKTSKEIWIENVSLQPFTKKQWRSHQDKSISKVRRSKVRFQISNADQTPLKGAQVSIKQTKSDFPFGCAMNYHILQSSDYQNWFLSRFKATTFTNEMKWYATEYKQGQENYTTADAMMKFARENGISVRGHNVFWDNPKYQPSWVRSLSTGQLRSAAARRIRSVVSRYRGKLIAWDVVNENLHFRFFEDELGQNASAEFYHVAQQLDPKTTMFLNEYNTIEYSNDKTSGPFNYHKKVKEILSFHGRNTNLSLGIGLQGHFGPGQPNLAYMRSALDILRTTGLPIWLTEVNVNEGPHQAQYLEEILREGYSHPAVQGIIMFAGPRAAGFNVTTLADINFRNTPAGDVVDKLIREWSSEILETKTDNEGYIDVSLSHGDYNVSVEQPLTNTATAMSLRVTRDKKRKQNVKVLIDT